MSALAADTDGAWTLVSTDGSTHGHEPIELNPNQRQETLAVELYEEDVPLAMGTIQIAELHKVRGQAGEMAWVCPAMGCQVWEAAVWCVAACRP